MQRIQLMIAGAQKAATSSLLRYLAEHPDVCSHWQEEINYFIKDSEYFKGESYALSRYFPCAGQEDKTIVAKSVEIMYSIQAAGRLQAYNPDIQLVFVLRHPVDRAYSAYWFARRVGWEQIPSFEDALWTKQNQTKFADDWLAEQNRAYLDRSLYLKHLKRLLTFFSEEQIHVILLEDVKNDAVSVCRYFYSLIGVEATFMPDVNRIYNSTAVARSEELAQFMRSSVVLRNILRRCLPEKARERIELRLRHWNERAFLPPPMNPATRERLLAYFKPHNAQLSVFLGRDLSGWNS